MSEWKEMPLADIVNLIGGGTPKTSVPEYWGGAIPWLSVADYSSSQKFAYKATKTITNLGLQNSSANLLNPGDIVISTRGTVGAVAVLRKKMAFNQTSYGIRAKEEFSTNEFVYYLLKYSVPVFLQMSYGAVFNTITRTTFQEMQISLPPLPEQKAIADVLNSLDDKIDLLHRRNEILEAMAQTLFRQWFIEEAGDDWEEKPLSFFGNVVCGKTPSKKIPAYFGGDIPFIKIPSMHGTTFVFQTSDYLSEMGKRSQIKKVLPSRSINVSCIATVGLVTMNAFESQTNQQINSIIPRKNIYRYFLYLMMTNLKRYLIAMASGGTATLNLNTGDFAKIEISYPPKGLLEKFHLMTEPFFEKIFQNQKQIRTLEKLRDTLLPKLMSGKVRVNFNEKKESN